MIDSQPHSASGVECALSGGTVLVACVGSSSSSMTSWRTVCVCVCAGTHERSHVRTRIHSGRLPPYAAPDRTEDGCNMRDGLVVVVVARCSAHSRGANQETVNTRCTRVHGDCGARSYECIHTHIHTLTHKHTLAHRETGVACDARIFR